MRRTRLRTIRDRAFGTVAPRVWNDLPADIVSASSLAIFNERLKIHLFGQSFGCVACHTDLSLRAVKCLWRNVEASCHKHFVAFSRNQITTSDVSQLAVRWPWSTGNRVDNTCLL